MLIVDGSKPDGDFGARRPLNTMPTVFRNLKEITGFEMASNILISKPELGFALNQYDTFSAGLVILKSKLD